MKTKDTRVCANPECGKEFTPARKNSRCCSKKCIQRVSYLRTHKNAKPRGETAAPKRETTKGANGQRGLDAGVHMRIANAVHPVDRSFAAGAAAANRGGMRLSRTHLDAWWRGLSDDGAFDFFTRVMFPGVGRSSDEREIAPAEEATA